MESLFLGVNLVGFEGAGSRVHGPVTPISPESGLGTPEAGVADKFILGEQWLVPNSRTA
jgi:hypothetical protein